MHIKSLIFLNELMLLIGKGALYWLKVTEHLEMLQKIDQINAVL